jgi:hypothetical protein
MDGCFGKPPHRAWPRGATCGCRRFRLELISRALASRLSSEHLEHLPFQSGGSHPKFTRLREPEITRPCGAAVKDAIIAIGVIEGPRRRRDLADSAVGIAWGAG